jgi:hypothetical protein
MIGSLLGIGTVCGLLLYASPLTPAERAARLPRWAGCYRLTLGPFSTGIEISELPIAPPLSFRLDSSTRGSSLGVPLGFMRVSPLSPNARHPEIFAPGWDLLGRDSIVVVWTEGFMGTELRLGRSHDSLLGIAELTADIIGPEPPPRAEARASPIPCESDGP